MSAFFIYLSECLCFGVENLKKIKRASIVGIVLVLVIEISCTGNIFEYPLTYVFAENRREQDANTLTTNIRTIGVETTDIQTTGVGKTDIQTTGVETTDIQTADDETTDIQTTDSMPELPLYARSALLLDASNNRVLYEENGYQVMAMASTTKIMTCILAIESGRLEEEVAVSKNAQKMPKVHLGMREGEKYKLEDLLYSLMLESHNDSAVAIAEHLGGSVEGFANMMNEKAKELGCNNTYFITPNGLDAKQNGKFHSTTARDLAVIAAYAIQNDEFLKIIGTRNYFFTELSGKRSFQISNKNRFLDLMDGAIGVKTGFTCEAGYCFVGALKKDGKTFISVVLGAGWPPNKNWKWSDTKQLMNFGVENYFPKNIYQKNNYSKMDVLNGVKEQVEVGAEQKEISLLLSRYDKVEIKKELPKILEAPVEKGTIIGYENYYVNHQLYTRIPIKIKESTEAYTWLYCIKKLIELFFVH